MRGVLLTIALCAALAIAGCGGSDSSSSSSGESSESATAIKWSPPGEFGSKPEAVAPGGTAPKKLETKELIEGTGAEAKAGDRVTVQYVGVDYKSGEEFDSSWSRNEPFSFALGGGEVIAGWDQGIVGMKVGGRRELIIPSELAYGPSGSPPVIAPNATLVFVVDLLAVK